MALCILTNLDHDQREGKQRRWEEEGWAVEREGEGTEIKRRRGPVAHHRHDTQKVRM